MGALRSAPALRRGPRRAAPRVARRLGGCSRISPRALGRRGYPRGVAGARDPARRPDRGDHRRVRRDHLGAVVQGVLEPRRGPNRDHAMLRHAVRSAPRSGVRQHVARQDAARDRSALVAHPRADPRPAAAHAVTRRLVRRRDGAGNRSREWSRCTARCSERSSIARCRAGDVATAGPTASRSSRRPPAGPLGGTGSVPATGKSTRRARKPSPARPNCPTSTGDGNDRLATARRPRRRLTSSEARPLTHPLGPETASREQPRTPGDDNTNVAHSAGVHSSTYDSCATKPPSPRSPSLRRRFRRTSPRRSPRAPTRVSSRMLRHNRSPVGRQRSHRGARVFTDHQFHDRERQPGALRGAADGRTRRNSSSTPRRRMSTGLRTSASPLMTTAAWRLEAAIRAGLTRSRSPSLL